MILKNEAVQETSALAQSLQVNYSIHVQSSHLTRFTKLKLNWKTVISSLKGFLFFSHPGSSEIPYIAQVLCIQNDHDN